MSIRPDFARTATGWFWLDRLFNPLLVRYFEWRGQAMRDRLFDRIGHGDRARGEAIFTQAVREAAGR